MFKKYKINYLELNGIVLHAFNKIKRSVNTQDEGKEQGEYIKCRGNKCLKLNAENYKMSD
jgi:hypothetical protein